MHSAQLILSSPMLAALVAAAWTDWRQRRIPNALTIPMAVGGLVVAILHAGPVGPAQSGLGLLTGFALSFVIFAIGGTSGGDVKLLAALGAWVGVWPILLIFIWSKLLGMAMALTQAAWQGRLTALFRNSTVLVMNVISSRDLRLREPGSALPMQARVDRPLAVAIPTLAATLLVLLVPATGSIL